MDAVIRILREGPVAGLAPLAIVLDAAAAGGGRAVARQVRVAARQTLGQPGRSAA